MVRLLNINTLKLQEFAGRPPPYVIASHRWLQDEATIDDMMAKRNTEAMGFQKVQRFCDYVRALPDSHAFAWLWIDTCCIDKSSSAELAEAINSMFKWYSDSYFCLAYLHDVESASNIQAFQASSWFKRGWTLQELLAPHVVIFLDREWRVIGHKQHADAARLPFGVPCGQSLNGRLARITGVPIEVLRDYEISATMDAEEKKSWLSDRFTTRREDMAYCMLGILNVSMTPIYGEGKRNAWNRLETELSRQTGDTGWSSGDEEPPYARLLNLKLDNASRGHRRRMESFRNGTNPSNSSVVTRRSSPPAQSNTTATDLGALIVELKGIRKLLEQRNDDELKRAVLMTIEETLKHNPAAAQPSPSAVQPEIQEVEPEPIRFLDCVGRKFSFPWRLCRKWKAMEALIKEAFQHVDIVGDHVYNGHYDLCGPEGEIILPQAWESIVQPGWSVSMAMWPIDPEQREAAEAQHNGSLTDKMLGNMRYADLPPPDAAPHCTADLSGDEEVISVRSVDSDVPSGGSNSVSSDHAAEREQDQQQDHTVDPTQRE